MLHGEGITSKDYFVLRGFHAIAFSQCLQNVSLIYLQCGTTERHWLQVGYPWAF
jgi:hypothetical protein